MSVELSSGTQVAKKRFKFYFEPARRTKKFN